jgi:hypothetical protein
VVFLGAASSKFSWFLDAAVGAIDGDHHVVVVVVHPSILVGVGVLGVSVVIVVVPHPSILVGVGVGVGVDVGVLAGVGVVIVGVLGVSVGIGIVIVATRLRRT